MALTGVAATFSSFLASSFFWTSDPLPALAAVLAVAPALTGARLAPELLVVVTVLMMLTVADIASATGFSTGAAGGAGLTTTQAGKLGVRLQSAGAGTTALHPCRVGLAAHCSRVGSTTAQPVKAGVAVHCVSVGNTALQPA